MWTTCCNSSKDTWILGGDFLTYTEETSSTCTDTNTPRKSDQVILPHTTAMWWRTHFSSRVTKEQIAHNTESSMVFMQS